MTKTHVRLFLTAVLFLAALAPQAPAAEFDWLADLNLHADADIAGFTADIGVRFHTGDPVVQAVDHPAHAYMIFRLSELAGQPPERVLEHYKAEKAKGWGAIAAGLGIKPGSPEFHQLKAGHDLPDRKVKKQKETKHKKKGKGPKDKG